MKKSQVLLTKLGILERRIIDGILDRHARDERDVSIVQLRHSVYQFSPGREWLLDTEFGDMVQSSSACFVGMVPVGICLQKSAFVF